MLLRGQAAEKGEKAHERVRVDQFPVGSVLLNELMARLMEEVTQQTVLKVKLYQVRLC